MEESKNSLWSYKVIIILYYMKLDSTVRFNNYYFDNYSLTKFNLSYTKLIKILHL